MEIKVPGIFLDDAYDGMCDAAAEGDERFARILEQSKTAPVRKAGRGVIVILDLSEEDIDALLSEAKYKAEYWGTDRYLDPADKDQAKAAAARRLVQRCKEALMFRNLPRD